MSKFLNNINLEAGNDIQFKTTAGANAGKIEQDGNNLVLSNAAGDVLLGDGSSDVYIGDGTNNVDILFEQSGSIKGDGSAITLTIGGANTTLNLENPNINGALSLGATSINNKLTFTTANGYILFDHEPSSDTGAYEGTTSVPLLKIDRGGSEKTILERVSQEGGLLLGADDSVIIAAGDTRGTLRSNLNEAAETVIFASEGGFHAYGFPSNDTTWSNRNEFRFRSDSGTASDNGLYIGDGSSTQFIDLSRNLKNIGTIGAGTITSTGHVAATEFRPTNIVTNKVVKFNGTQLDDANITDTGSLITLGSNTTLDGVLGVEVGNAFYSTPLLEITSSGTPTQIKITTNIPWSSTHAHVVTIRGFRYGGAEMSDLQIGWHVYNNSFYNRAITSSGSWAPVVRLAVENSKVVIHLDAPGYWPKLYVESLYNVFGGTDDATGWSWADAAISADSGTPNQTVPYKINFGGGEIKAGSNTVWHAGNDGSGSGLDADLLDSQEGSYYRNASNLNAGTIAAARLSTASTQPPNDNSTKIATTAYVQTELTDLIGAAPAALDTLSELADAINDDASFSSTVTTALGNRLRVDTASQGLNSTQKSNARTNLGLGSAATSASSAFAPTTGSTSIVSLGTVVQGDWNAGVIASAYLDADTAHLSGTQTFSGAKTFSSGLNISVSTSNTQLKLKRTGTATGEFNIYTNNDTLFFNNVGQSSFPMVIDEDGNVGIGTTSPAAKLHAYNSAGGDATDKAGMLSEAVMKLQPHASNSTNMLFAQVNSGNGIGIQVTNGPATANWDIALSPFGGNVGIGTTSPSYKLDVAGEGKVTGKFRVGGAVMLAEPGTGVLLFGSEGGSQTAIYSASTERIRINASGKVGIGTNNPSNTLDIAGGLEVNAEAYIRSTNNVGLRIQTTDQGTTGTDGLRVGLNATHAFVWQYENLPLAFATNGSQKATILANGNFGIGNAAPSYKLDVNGDFRVVNAATFSAGTYFDQYLYHAGDTDTFIRFQTNDVNLTAAGQNLLRVDGNSTQKTVVVNEVGIDVDFRVEASGEANALFVRGSDGNVGIGTTSPSYKLDVAASGGIRAGGKTTYTKTFSSGLDTSGELVAEITSGYNGASALFEFTCFGGGAGCYQRVIWSLYNASGTWYASNPINEGTNHFDVAYSSGEFTFKTRSGTQAYQPRVIVEAAGDSIDNSYA